MEMFTDYEYKFAKEATIYDELRDRFDLPNITHQRGQARLQKKIIGYRHLFAVKKLDDIDTLKYSNLADGKYRNYNGMIVNKPNLLIWLRVGEIKARLLIAGMVLKNGNVCHQDGTLWVET